MSKNKELLPCPFCGSKAEYEEFNDGFLNWCRIKCCKCGIFIDTPYKNSTIKVWNTRYKESEKNYMESGRTSLFDNEDVYKEVTRRIICTFTAKEALNKYEKYKTKSLSNFINSVYIAIDDACMDKKTNITIREQCFPLLSSKEYRWVLTNKLIADGYKVIESKEENIVVDDDASIIHTGERYTRLTIDWSEAK